MPADFDECRRKGGRFTTETVGDDKYRHVCWYGGKPHYGEVKTKRKYGMRNKKSN